MVFGCAAQTVKCLVVFFNLLACIAGLALIIGGAIAVTDERVQKLAKEEAELEKIYPGENNPAIGGLVKLLYGIIAIGCFIFLLGFLGCAGGLLENKCMLGTFIAIMIFLMITQLALGILAAVYKDKLENLVYVHLNKAADILKNITIPLDQKNIEIELWENLQKNFPCCGIDGTDFITNIKEFEDKKCKKEYLPPKKENGCPYQFWEQIKSLGILAAALVLVFLVFELASIIFVCCLTCSISEISYPFHH